MMENDFARTLMILPIIVGGGWLAVGLKRQKFGVASSRPLTVKLEQKMAKGKDKPAKQTKKPKSDKPKGSGSAYQQDKASGKRG